MDLHERYLGIDYGEKRIGLALTDPLGMFSFPLKTLENNKTFWIEFNKVLREYNIVKIILGYPLKENGEKSGSTLAVEKFCEELSKKVAIEIEYFDERYSSEIAKSRILDSVSSRKKRKDKSLVDKNAAAVILEDYLRERARN